MRIWSLHPKYLDSKGLVAAWREALLAQKVLKGETKGYTRHPQLDRFKAQADPVAAIATYLLGLYEEAQSRAFQFDRDKIAPGRVLTQIPTTEGQVLYEWNHLKRKLKQRDPRKYKELSKTSQVEAHPFFKVIGGAVESWEVTK
ncbi:MAG: hypothetical protein HYR56_18515 [Acidobacteria bacterium]|nr:hypothetical protein [Acidobacteriota bacterium]MBI3421800.1 hypothetical protein [Acidobacteriota bacterium]